MYLSSKYFNNLALLYTPTTQKLIVVLLFGQLSQGVGKQMTKGSKAIFLLYPNHKSQLIKKVTYVCLMCNNRPKIRNTFKYDRLLGGIELTIKAA